jgi:uncharacterized repeat protein (TIGR02543 family)
VQGGDTFFMPADDLTLTANWIANEYEVAYDGNGSDGGATADSSHTYGVAKDLTANGYTRTGHAFDGWNTQADGKGTAYTDEESVTNLSATQGATVTLYAQWTANTYTVTYDGNGSDGGATTDSSHTYGVAKDLTANGYTRTGYTFNEWNTDADGSGDSYADKESVTNLSATQGATVTLYAQWTAIPPGTYAISGTVSGDAQTGVTLTLTGDASATTTSGADGTYTFPNLADGSYAVTPTLAGHTFNPSSRSVTVSGANQPGQNFVATAVTPGTYAISGTVSGDAQAGVTLTLAGAASATTTSGADGTYTFSNLADGSYAVTPTLAGHTFNPSSRSVTVSGANQPGQDFVATAAEFIAVGSVFEILADDVPNLPNPGLFMVRPKVYTQYDYAGRTGLKSNARVLTKVDKNVGAPAIDCEWTRRLRLYDSKAQKVAEKEGKSVADWLAEPGNQSDLPMNLFAESRGAGTQMVRIEALAVPKVAAVVAGEKDPKGNDTLVITGQWFGTRAPKVWREYVDAKTGVVIKRQPMKVLKPTQTDADAGFQDAKGKPAHMNCVTGASKVVVIVPAKAPNGQLNGTVVVENGVGIATGNTP